MKKKKYIGKLISVKFKDRKKTVDGYVIDYNDDWTLMKYNPVDYIMDGYVIFSNKNIEGFRRDIEEKWREKVINLKGLQSIENENVPLNDLPKILEFLTDNFGLFLVYTNKENVCYLCRLRSINNNELVMDSLSPKGKWDGELKFKTGDIRKIEFNTDYINSLKLVAASKKIKRNDNK